MSVEDLFTKEMWLAVGREIGGVAGRWWDENREDLTAISREEVESVLRALKKGDTELAKIEIAIRMNPTDWAAYRDGTTKQLAGIAARRFAVMEALADLGTRAAIVLGKAAGAALGL